MKKLATILAVLVIVLSGCSEADMANYNVSKEADNFNVQRRIVFINNVTGDYLLEIVGNCSVKADEVDKQLELTCKTGDELYQKHYLGLNETTTYVVEELGETNADPYRYMINFRPETLIPNIDLQVN